jgi:hypothetical protein
MTGNELFITFHFRYLFSASCLFFSENDNGKAALKQESLSGFKRP